jgi:maltooligosyltrehalose trehalohydrolase
VEERVSQAAVHPSQVVAENRLLPIGAEVLPSGGVHFRVWAPKCRRVDVVIDSVAMPIAAEENGYFSGVVADAGAGTLYQFRLDGKERLYPDPASRFQPRGPHGPSQVIDPKAFRWTDQGWRGVAAEGQVISETHIGSFTPKGTWAGAIEKLPLIKDVGITCLEIMPVAQFSGKFGWGYDGVDLFAPYAEYGTPDDFRRFVDAAHAAGIGVILDVVYNHFGPDGNYLPQFADDYLSSKHPNDWGQGINFDGENSVPVREFFISNARYWISEFHLDGFRFDATQVIVDDSPEHILTAIRNASIEAAGGRQIYTVGENEKQNSRLVRQCDIGGCGLTALWNDDWHHSAIVAATGRREAYYTDYRGTAQELVSAAKWGFLYQGQRYKWQKQRRGTSAYDLAPTAFVHFLENHDQLANSGRGLRLHQLTSPAELRVMTALLLLGPQTPMLFMGQEFAASSQFHYFLDVNMELARLVYEGRRKDLSQFPSVATPAMSRQIQDPSKPETFMSAKLDYQERDTGSHRKVLQLHKELLRLRREDPTLRHVQRTGEIDGAVLGPAAFVLRYFGSSDSDSDDRLLLVNLGVDLELDIAPEPLLAPPAQKRWALAFSTEDPLYGGGGTAHPDTEEEGWLLLGRSAVLLRAAPAAEATVESRIVKSEPAKKKES